MKENRRGITLIALIVTILVLLILSGISISVLTGENGIINNASSAKEKTEIAEEKEMVEISAVQAAEKDVYGIVKLTSLQTSLDGNTGKGTTRVTEDEEESLLYAQYVVSGRMYEVDTEGNVEYIGGESELATKAIISANPTNDLTPRLVQNVEVTVKTLINVEDENIRLKYAWTKNETDVPTNYTTATLIGTKKRRNTTISSVDTKAGEYYLQVKVEIGKKEIYETFGPYAIKDHTTLVSCASERNSTSAFLGNTSLLRNKIESVKLVTSLEGHTIGDSNNTWDVSQSKNGRILAWYGDEDSDGFYEVTIGQNGGIMANANSSYLFNYIGYNGDNAEIYGIENLDTSLVTKMNNMFGYCRNITELDLSTFDTSNVTDMSSMFSQCQNLTNLEIQNFNTENVINMSSMFYQCQKLTSLELKKFNTKNVTNMAQMFWGCTEATFSVSSFDTSKVTNMYNMFGDCGGLDENSLSSFNTKNVTDMTSMFMGCTSLSEFDFSNFSFDNCTGMNSMFYGCKNLKSIDLTGKNFEKVTDMSQLFASCSNLTTANLSNLNTSKCANIECMFWYCSSLKTVNMSNFDTSNVTDMRGVFYECTSLTNVDVTNWNTAKVTDMQYMFFSDSGLTTVDVSSFDTSSVTVAVGMFGCCRNLKTIFVGELWDLTERFTNVIYSSGTDTVTLKGN